MKQLSLKMFNIFTFKYKFSYLQSVFLVLFYCPLYFQLDCCGISSYKDWINTPWGKEHFGQVPPSCCKVEEKCDNQIPVDNSTDIFEQVRYFLFC